MRWFKIKDDYWISERVAYQQKSYVRQIDGKFYACGEKYGINIFNSLKMG